MLAILDGYRRPTPNTDVSLQISKQCVPGGTFTNTEAHREANIAVQISTLPVMAKLGNSLGERALNDKGVVSAAEYVYTLSEEEKHEVDMAMLYFKGNVLIPNASISILGNVVGYADPLRQGLGLDGDQVSPAVFPLPNLGKMLRALATDLHESRCFFIVRGLDPCGLTPEDTILRYMGVASFVGDKIGVQDGYGNVFGKG